MSPAPIATDSSANLPSIHNLAAATVTLACIDEDGTPVKEAHESYLRVPTGGVFGAGDLVAGERLLIRLGLLELTSDVLRMTPEALEIREAPHSARAELMLVASLAANPPVWLLTATAGQELISENIPDQEWGVLTRIFDASRRETILLGLGQKYEKDRLEKLGADGEVAAVEALRGQLVAAGRPELAQEVRRVSLISDSLGYDIVAPTTQGGVRRLEVKAMRGPNPQASFFLSRNEAEVGSLDPDWSLLLCQLDYDGRALGFYWTTCASLRPHLPEDQKRGRWMSTRIRLPINALIVGLPSAQG